jgi:hypothetical protein
LYTVCKSLFTVKAEVCSNGVEGYFKLEGEGVDIRAGTGRKIRAFVKTMGIWGKLPQENFEKREGNATLSGSN